MNVQLRIDSLLSIADWQKAIQTNVANGKSILYIPIQSSELGIEFFYDNAKKRIDSGNLVKIETKKLALANSEIVAAKTYYETVILGKASSNPFSGIIHTYSITANFLYDYTFEGGKIISHGIVAPKLGHQTIKKANGLQVYSQTCEEWGYYIIWEIGPPTLLYTFWVCSGMPDCPPVSTLAISIGAGKQYVGVNCAPPPGSGGSPSGGGAGNNQTACDAANASVQQFIANSEMEASSELVSSNIINTSNPYIKYKNIEWKCLRGAVLPSIYVLSQEEGIVKKVRTFPNDPNSDMRWEWESLIHKKATLVGGDLLSGKVSLVTESGTPSFVAPGNNVLWAGMQLSIILNFKPLVLPIPNCAITLTWPYDNTYKPSFFWDANP
ncbi:MAG: hypothetical protein WCH78_00750 [Bacteroidota bacterium]